LSDLVFDVSRWYFFIAADSILNLLEQIPALVSFLSKGTTLPIGTVIMTGTPGGIGCAGPEEKWRPLKPGDKVEVEVSSVGVLRHGIVYE
jgi:2-keto-4-pentenoate hydratase/2-oxohepta-3-ene-1,7-dioic acid hydratase in catechol pathway